MDTSAVNVNATVDDFDSVLSYPEQSAWQTPDPSSPSFDASATSWWMGTYHKTDVVGASVAFNFTGPALFIYGHSGPAYGSYEVQIDSTTSKFSAYAANNASRSFLLYGASNLTYAPHTLTLRNLGAVNGDAGGDTLLFDYLQATVQLAPAGATVSNTTIEEDNPALTYSGTWGSNKSPNFSGGGTIYTNKDKAAVSLSFHGSAIYVFGDKKNDHGLYSVALDNRPVEIYSGVSGCGGAYGTTCEQQKPTLNYFASNLDSTLHTLTIANIAGVNNSFFDLDSIVVTVPSVYAPRDLSASPSSSSTSPAGSSTGTPQENSAVNLLHSSLLLLLVSFFRVFHFNSRH
ncbi:hypothetical protein D9615_007837 [Tricholomella constricta]|uniref:Uncharacterized protein n=1 Tax=Tricholomella constricta TaxID=117010 RepID=A0A8H5H4S5_9AGAR|nr:hypothetical protein D9615_007837 [Tricholomella constricta]